MIVKIHCCLISSKSFKLSKIFIFLLFAYPQLCSQELNNAYADILSSETQFQAVRKNSSIAPDSNNEITFQNTKVWSQRLDDPDRDKWQKPNEVIEKLALSDGSIIADIGAGTGYFSTRIAQRYPKAKVYAVDLSSEMLDFIREKSAINKLNNIQVVQATKFGPSLPEKVSLILLVNAYVHREDPVKYFIMLKNYLNQGGRIALIFFDENSEKGPPKNMRISEKEAIDDMKRAGFELMHSYKIISDEYFLIFELAKQQ